MDQLLQHQQEDYLDNKLKEQQVQLKNLQLEVYSEVARLQLEEACLVNNQKKMKILNPLKDLCKIREVLDSI